MLGVYFVIIFTNDISGAFHLQYVALSINNPSLVTANTDIAPSDYHLRPFPGMLLQSMIGCSIGYDTLSGGQSVQVVYLTNSLALSTHTTFTGSIATIMVLTADITNPSNLRFTFHSMIVARQPDM